MAQRKALYAIVTTLVVAILALTVLSFQPSNQPTSNRSSVSSSNASSFQVLKTNVIVNSAVECMVYEGIGHTCPTVTTDPSATPSSFKGVELIAY